MVFQKGILGIKPPEHIFFKGNNNPFIVCSEGRVPMVVNDISEGQISLRAITRRLMGSDFKEDIDIFDYWY